jgi:hypothetical protein
MATRENDSMISVDEMERRYELRSTGLDFRELKDKVGRLFELEGGMAFIHSARSKHHFYRPMNFYLYSESALGICKFYPTIAAG